MQLVKRVKGNWYNCYDGFNYWFYGVNGKNKSINFKNLEIICKGLSCTPNDIISFEDNFSEEG